MATISETLAIAVQQHQSGRLQVAEQIYRQVLAVEPNQADVLHLLGVIAHQMGKNEEAVEYISRAIQRNETQAAFHSNLGEAYRALRKIPEAVACYRRALELKPDYAEAAYNLGNTLRGQGKLEEAVVCYRRVLELNPHFTKASYKLGNALRAQGKSEEAVACYRRALELNPDHAEAHNNLANAFTDQKQLDEAVASYRRALELRPNFAEAHNNLGNVLKDQGKLDEAIACFHQALNLKPNFAEVYYNLGIAFQGQENFDEAVACYRRTLELKPDFAEAYNNLAIVLEDQGKLDEAVACCRQALELKPDYAEAHSNLAIALKNQGKLDEAVACCRRVLELKPDHAETHNNLGSLLRLRERYAEAREAYEKALRLNPDRDLLRLSIAAICPAVFENSTAIDEYRTGLLAQVEDLARGKFNINVSQLRESAAEPPFNLQYHGKCDRPIKEAWARLFRNLPSEETPPSGSPRPKLGLVVTQSHEGIFLRWWTELLRRIKPKGWEMVVVCSRSGAQQIRAAVPGSIQLLPVSGQFDQIVKTVREARFDVLCHWETGSDSTNYFLPYFRLAAVQCNLFGIQATSGIPQMDYYLSTADIEPEGAEAHYSEKLLRGRSMLSYHIRPSLPAVPKPRAAFGFRADQHLYACPQNLRKFHPEFDPLLAGILEEDPAGVVVIVEDHGACLAPMLRRRFARTMPEVLDRVVFLPHQAYADYLCLVAAADVVLDPLHYSGGTTTLEALSLGKPIVTWPGRFQIGRGGLACYRRMGIAGFVAEDAADYVRMAVALGTDAEYRQAAGQEIKAASGQLFENVQSVREYEEIFTRLVEEARGR